MKNNRKEIAKAISSITELGLSVIISFLLWIIIAAWIKNKFSLGNYVMVIGVLLGAGSAILSFVKFCKIITSKEKDYEQ